MPNELYVPPSRAEKRFEMTSSNAITHYLNSNTVQPSIEDVHALCRATIALVGQISDGLAMLQRDLNVTNDLVLRFHKVMPQHMTFSDYFEEVRNMLRKR
ncbi:hypothetical protein [Vineibacter terrae]|uniref:hypothetical protein n=1 Tax=Vineibacter terrae TaxID=2586908 RepID=UPI002E364536|nr:hypothetical protein [Vineibacter terrae]HEX2886004.1 hypothetical protein [Vineibacter terrae]